MASVRQKGGKWYYRITITCGGNSHKYIERGSFKTKKEALEAGKRAELAYKDGDVVERRKSMTLDFLAEEWINNSNSKYKQTTINRYKKELKILFYQYLLIMIFQYWMLSNAKK